MASSMSTFRSSTVSLSFTSESFSRQVTSEVKVPQISIRTEQCWKKRRPKTKRTKMVEKIRHLLHGSGDNFNQLTVGPVLLHVLLVLRQSILRRGTRHFIESVLRHRDGMMIYTKKKKKMGGGGSVNFNCLNQPCCGSESGTLGRDRDGRPGLN